MGLMVFDGAGYLTVCPVGSRQHHNQDSSRRVLGDPQRPELNKGNC